MKRISLTIKTTKKREIVDITDNITRHMNNENESYSLCTLFLTHTTAALTTADLDPGTDLDMLDAFEVMIPKLTYRHPHNPEHVPDHILSSVIGTSLILPVEKSELVLGMWQRVVLVELDGPRERKMIVSFL